MGVGTGVEIVKEGEHLGGVAAGAEDYQEVGGVAATASEGWLRVEGGEGVEEAELLKREGDGSACLWRSSRRRDGGERTKDLEDRKEGLRRERREGY